MSDSEKRSLGSFPAQLCLIIALIIFFVPTIACADSFLMLHQTGNSSPEPDPIKHSSKAPVTVGLNENGDLTVRHRDLSLVVAYNPPNEIVDYQERIKIAQRQDCPAISGISLRISFVF